MSILAPETRKNINRHPRGTLSRKSRQAWPMAIAIGLTLSKQ